MKKRTAARTGKQHTTRKRTDDPFSLLVQAVEHSADMIAMADCEGHLIYANRAFLEAHGSSEPEIIGSHFGLVLSVNNAPTLVQEVGEKCLQDEGWAGECWFARRNGTAFPIFLSAGPVKDEDGRVVGMFGIGQDISDRKRVEDALQQSEAQFRQLTENIHAVFFALTPDPLQITYISPAYDEVWGRSRQELYGRTTAWTESIHPEDRERALGVFAQSLLGIQTNLEYRVVRPDGSVRAIHARSFPVNDAQGRLCRIVGIAEDITPRRKEEAALRDAHERLDIALRASEQQAREVAKLTELVDILQSCRTVDEAYKIAGNTMPTILAAQSGALCITSPSRNLVEVVIAWGDSSATENTFAPEHCWALRRGKIHMVDDVSSPLRCTHVRSSAGGFLCVPLTAQGETLGVLCLKSPSHASTPASRTSEDPMNALARQAMAVGERISLALANLRLREVLRNQSIRDPLTGLFNRRYMEESLEREVRRAIRNQQSVALLMLDIDHFKKFNDTFGHQAGDTLLRALGELLSRQTRGEDVACRYGGEEFALILSGASLAQASTRAELLREELKHLVVQYAGQVLGTITMSIGISACPVHGGTSERLLEVADQALYRAKSAGRDRAMAGDDVPDPTAVHEG